LSGLDGGTKDRKMSAMTPFESALVMHLVGDWLLQNDWMARNKVRLHHPAAWVHSGIHGVLQGIVFGWQGGLVLAVIHMLVDTRVPLKWWVKTYRQTSHNPMGDHVFIWDDQVIHIATIALWIQFGAPLIQ
jgi:hypothetical protein